MPAFRNPGQHPLSRSAAAYGMNGAKPFWLQAGISLWLMQMHRVLGLPSDHRHSGPKPGPSADPRSINMNSLPDEPEPVNGQLTKKQAL